MGLFAASARKHGEENHDFARKHKPGRKKKKGFESFLDDNHAARELGRQEPAEKHRRCTRKKRNRNKKEGEEPFERSADRERQHEAPEHDQNHDPMENGKSHVGFRLVGV